MITPYSNIISVTTLSGSLLDLYTGAAAAYSLRKLRNGYTGGAIEVRRSADGATQDIGFVDGELDTASLEEFVNCEDVAPADHGSGAAAAYSLRYVSASYTGDVIQVRRSSDDTTQDFNPTEITDGTLATFCGAGDGFVTTWYDQSGNGFNATQTTASAQPQIVSSGSVITDNGKPTLDFDGSDDYLSNASSLSYSGGVSWYGVQNVVLTSGRLWSDDITGVQGYMSFVINSQYLFNDNGGGYKNFVPSGWSAQQQLASLNFDDNNGNYNYAFDGSNTSGSISGWTGPLGTSGAANVGIMGAGNGAQYGEGKLQELVIYPNNQSSNRPKIEANINNYYSIYTNTNNGYVTTWYDQSGNSNDATQTTATDQPQIVSGGSVILENGKPALDFDGSDDYMVATYTLGTDLTSVLVLKSNINTSSADGTIYQYNIDNVNHFAHGFRNGGLYTRMFKNGILNEENGYDFSSTSQFLSFNIYDYDNSTNYLYVDNVLRTDNNAGRSTTTSNSFISIMARSSGDFNIDGKLSELIFYPSDQSSNRTGIETNINDFYSIYYVPSDSDAQAFVSRVETAGGSLSYTESQAVDTLVSDLKDAGIWTKMKAIYPMVGASAAACAQNLKSSSFTGTFNGGVTFSSNGVQFNGTSGYLDTQFVPSVEFGAGNGSISVYSRTSGSRSADFGRYTGSQNAIVAYVSLNGRVYSYFGDTGYTFQADTNNGLGLFNYQRTSNSNKNVFVNSTKVLNANTTFTGWPNLFMPIGAYFLNATFQETSGREFAFAHLGDALTDTEASDFYTAVQAFQTTLSRNV